MFEKMHVHSFLGGIYYRMTTVQSLDRERERLFIPKKNAPFHLTIGYDVHTVRLIRLYLATNACVAPIITSTHLNTVVKWRLDPILVLLSHLMENYKKKSTNMGVGV